jgi:hypothetical protein
MDAKIQAWLREILGSLSLNTDFLDRVLKSAREAVTHACQTEIEMEFEHIHLKVFSPEDSVLDEKNWGFFRIEKVGTPVEGASIADHSIEFYLYREG